MTGMTCPNCSQPYDTKPINEEHHPKYFCKNNHFCCNSCWSLLKNCPICKENKVKTNIEKTNKAKTNKGNSSVTDEVSVKIETEEDTQRIADEEESKRKNVLKKGTVGLCKTSYITLQLKLFLIRS